jgi:hypothetical protein
MSRQLLFVLLALGLVAGASFLLLKGTEDRSLQMGGNITQVRTFGTDDTSTLVIVDFQLNNPSLIQYVHKEMLMKIVRADGSTVEGRTIAGKDLDRVLEYKPDLGRRVNAHLLMGDKIAGKTFTGRTVSSSFLIPEEQVMARRGLEITITDLDGKSFSFAERR